MRSSYNVDDVELLLTDLSGKIEAMGTEDRERMIQSGVHYSEMLPKEYKPSDEYIKVYEDALHNLTYKTAQGIVNLSEKLYSEHGGKFVIISLARAGLPIGVLIKRYIKYKYGIELPHYGISIIRGKGIDKNAMEYIYNKCSDGYGVNHFQFIDGWVGKGAISKVLVDAVKELVDGDSKWEGLSSELGVVADPANITELCGTHEDIMIPSACLNGIVSGLVSRTIRNSLIGKDDFDGAVYFSHMECDDMTYEFIDKVASYYNRLSINIDSNKSVEKGVDVVKRIQEEYGITDINFIKPSIGEATRVILRRVPWRVLINPRANEDDIRHIKVLCKEKGIEIEVKEIGNYNACGIIKDIHSDI